MKNNAKNKNTVKAVVDEFSKFIDSALKKDYYDKHILIRLVRNVQDDKKTTVQVFRESGDELRFQCCHILPCSIDLITSDHDLCGALTGHLDDRFNEVAEGRDNRIFLADSIVEFDAHAKCCSICDCGDAGESMSFKYFDHDNGEYVFAKCERRYAYTPGKGTAHYPAIAFYSMTTGKLIDTVSAKAMASKEWIISKPRNPLSKSDERIVNGILSMPALKGAKKCVIRSETNTDRRNIVIRGIDKTGRHDAFEVTINDLKIDGSFAAFPDRADYKYDITDGKIGQLDYSCAVYKYGDSESKYK